MTNSDKGPIYNPVNQHLNCRIDSDRKHKDLAIQYVLQSLGREWSLLLIIYTE